VGRRRVSASTTGRLGLRLRREQRAFSLFLQGKSPRFPASKKNFLARGCDVVLNLFSRLLKETAELLAIPPAAAVRNRSIGAENTVAAREKGPRKPEIRSGSGSV
jgi:hypothetical protein